MEQILGFADFQRSRLLAFVLSVPAFRRTFQSRAARLATLYILNLVLATAFAVLFLPLALLLTPLLYGVPHLWASFRYVTYAIRGRERRTLRVAAEFALAGSGLAILLLRFSNWDISQIGPALIVFFALAWMRMAHTKWWMLLPLLTLALFYRINSIGTAAVLVYAHNFLAYVFWLRATRTDRERATALFALSALIAVTALIFAGTFDHALFLFSSHVELPAEIYSAAEQLNHLVGLPSGLLVLQHWLAAFAIAQSMHYFVWLKAIPEQQLPSENPTSFRRSLQKLSEDYGKIWTPVILVSVAAFAIAALVNFTEARLVYGYLAAAHAFWEIAGLPLAITAKRA